MPKFNCECGGLILPNYDALAVGHNVNFSIQQRVNGYGTKIIVSKKPYSGEILAIDGDRLTVKAGKRTYDLYRYDVTPKGAPTITDYLRVGKCLCAVNSLKKSA